LVLLEVVLAPFKSTTHGRRTLDTLQKLRPRFPLFKSYVEWDDGIKRHQVYQDDLTEQEAAIIAAVKWPTREKMLDALSPLAVDNLADLIADNPEIRAALTSKEVR
jgi:hypothetical protein